ncbi:hypothetical protein Tco_1408534 [Tanacetum coccineum]
MIDELSIIETDEVIHTVETDMVKLVVDDVESSGKSADEIDKETVSFGEMQLKQEDRSCVHASIELPFACRSWIVPTHNFSWKASVNVFIAFECHNQLEWFLWELSQYIPLVGYTIPMLLSKQVDFFTEARIFYMGSVHHIKFHSAFPRVIQVFFKHSVGFVVTTEVMTSHQGSSDKLGFIKLREKLGNSKAPKDYGRDKSVKSKPSLTQDQAHATSIMEKAQIIWVFVLKHSQKKHNDIQKGMTRWQSSGVHTMIKQPQLKPQ